MSEVHDNGYSLNKAKEFAWGSVSGDLHPERIEHLQKYLVGNRVLDAGCGGGAFVHYLTEAGFDCTGVDLHDTFLEVAREKGYRGTFVQGSLTQLPFPDNTFDTTFCYDVLEHVDDVVAIRELARVTRKRIIVAVPRNDERVKPYGLTFTNHLDFTHLRYYSEDSLMELMATVEPCSCQVFPELFVPIREFAFSLFPDGLEPLETMLQEELAQVWQEFVRELPVFEGNFVPQNITAPSVRGPRSAVLNAAANLSEAREAFAEPYAAQFHTEMARAADHYQKVHGETTADTLPPLLNEICGRVFRRFWQEWQFASIPTGLVAVADLEPLPENGQSSRIEDSTQ